ncbi:actin-binding FH2 [Neocallimastix californiae]|uniref:Actin-binding FH2 n=1 Tax=Neocallimastix californiae TaxID=1754190 RepID=A0A1Y2FFX2_9FUNG|nr:actin-binding FH2 [Neocallimastix californiae]|eukprot:ORY82802.1 actin-binding FH2 [Neocallimastix californiae]
MNGKGPASILNTEKKPQKYYPNTKMKFFEWEKIPKKIALNSYIWNNKKKIKDIDINGIISEIKNESIEESNNDEKDLECYLAEDLGVFNELESLFSKVQNIPQDKNTNNTEFPEKKQKEEIEIIDNNRARNMMIALRMAIKSSSLEELCNAIETMDESIMTPSKIKQLVQHIPQTEETIKIPNYEQKMLMWEFKNDFNEVITDLDKDINTVLNAIQELKDSEHLPKLLELILTIGNFMNGETIKGGAYGFKISSINKLNDIKSNDKKMTLLNYITSVIQNKFPELLNITSELSGINDACKISTNIIKEDITKIKATLKKNTAILNNPNFGKKIEPKNEEKEDDNEYKDNNENNKVDENNNFTIKMKSFYETANNKFSEIEGLYKLLEKNITEITESFGEQNIASEDFFGIFKTFLISFNKSLAENERVKKRNELLEMRKQREIELKKLKKKASQTNTNENDDGKMIDMVLETLKKRKAVSIKKNDLTEEADENEKKDNDNNNKVDDLLNKIKKENEKIDETTNSTKDDNFNSEFNDQPLTNINESYISDKQDNNENTEDKKEGLLDTDSTFEALDWKNFKFGNISIDDFFKSDYFLFKNLDSDNEKNPFSNLESIDEKSNSSFKEDTSVTNDTISNLNDNSQLISIAKSKNEEALNLSVNMEMDDSNLTLFKSKESVTSSQYNSNNSINKDNIKNKENNIKYKDNNETNNNTSLDLSQLDNFTKQTMELLENL